MSWPEKRGSPRAPLYQAETFSTICRISGEVQLWRRISKPHRRGCGVITAASSQSSTPGFSRTWSGTPITPMSCSNAATSSRSRSARSPCPACFAHAEQVSATRRLCPAVAACLHCKAVNRLLAMPSRSCTSRVSGGWPATAGACWLPAVMLSSWASSVPNSDIHCSAGAGRGCGARTRVQKGVSLMDDRSARAGAVPTLPLSNLGHGRVAAKCRPPAAGFSPLSSMVFARNDIATRHASEANSLGRPRLRFALTMGA